MFQMQGMLGSCLEKLEAAAINSSHVPCDEIANVGSDAGRRNINNNVRPFE